MSNDSPRGHSVTADDWDRRYRDGDTPWNTLRPSAELVRVIDAGLVPIGRAIELGCGAGTNAIFLAQRGFAVTALDLSPLAIDQARQQAQSAGVRVDFYVADVATPPAGGGPYDFVFDRGCYHCVRRTGLAGYRAALELLTRPGSKFLLLAGNANEKQEVGPPKVTEEEIRGELAGLFAIEWLRPFRFDSPPGIDEGEGFLGWSCFMTRREA